MSDLDRLEMLLEAQRDCNDIIRSEGLEPFEIPASFVAARSLYLARVALASGNPDNAQHHEEFNEVMDLILEKGQ